MAKEITIHDCEELFSKFLKYTETAEQHEFPRLAMIHLMLNKTMQKIREDCEVSNQKEALAMFRVVLGAIGEDASVYMEEV